MSRFVLFTLLVASSLDLLTLSRAVQPGGLACEGCHGVISEIHEKLSKPSKATTATRAPQLVGKICKLENLVKYVYSPPKMVKACNELIGQHKAAIIDSLVRHFEENPDVTANELEADICFKISKSCVGIKASPDAVVSETVVADQMLDGKSGQTIVLEQDGIKIVPKVIDAPTDKTSEKPTKQSKKKNKEKKSEEENAKKKPNSKKDATGKRTKEAKKPIQKTEL